MTAAAEYKPIPPEKGGKRLERRQLNHRVLYLAQRWDLISRVTCSQPMNGRNLGRFYVET